MATKQEVADEMVKRVKAEVKHFNGVLPERYTLAWHGYLAAIFEWGLIDIPHYDNLLTLLPKISEPNPVAEIFEGREDED